MINLQPKLRETKGKLSDDFDAASRRYDLLSALNPGYSANLRKSARRLELSTAPRILDLCCGTGISTAALVREYPDAEIVGLDISQGMLAAARRKATLSSATFVHGDAMDPAASGVTGLFDGILMAYGIRNVPDPDLCLSRLLELLKPGAPIAFHEYALSGGAWSRAVWNGVAGAVIIPLGRIATGSPKLFRYLRDSVNHFDRADQFEARLSRAGFVDCRTEPMGGWQRGIVHTFVARRPL